MASAAGDGSGLGSGDLQQNRWKRSSLHLQAAGVGEFTRVVGELFGSPGPAGAVAAHQFMSRGVLPDKVSESFSPTLSRSASANHQFPRIHHRRSCRWSAPTPGHDSAPLAAMQAPALHCTPKRSNLKCHSSSRWFHWEYYECLLALVWKSRACTPSIDAGCQGHAPGPLQSRRPDVGLEQHQSSDSAAIEYRGVRRRACRPWRRAGSCLPGD